MRFRNCLHSIILLLAVVPSYSQNIEYLSSTLYSGEFTAVAISGDYAYCTIKRNLFIYSIGDPSSPDLVKVIPCLGGDGAYLHGNLIYFTQTSGYRPNVQIVDISDPLNPLEVNEITWAYDIAFDSNYIYLARNSAGLDIYDNTNPQNPVLVSNIHTHDHTRGVVVRGNYAYVADAGRGLTVVSIADRLNPIMVGNNNPSAMLVDADTSWYYIYAADSYYGLRVFDITDPTHPRYSAGLELPCGADQIVVDGYYAYLRGSEGIYTVYIGFPLQPRLMASYDGLPSPNSFFKCDTLICVGGESSLINNNRYGMMQILNIANHDSIDMLGGISLQQRSSRHVCVSGNYAFAGDLDLSMVDITNPLLPVPMAQYQAGGIGQLVYRDNYIYGLSGNGLKIISFADPANPALIGQANFRGDPGGICLRGDYAYIVYWQLGLGIFDISDPTDIVQVGSYYNNTPVRDVAVRDNYAYLAEDYEGLCILDVNDPANPVPVGRLDTDLYMNKIILSGDYAYTVVGGQMLVIDISDPANPQATTLFESDYDAGVICVQENLAYVGSYGHYLLAVIDITNPAGPRELARRRIPGPAYDIFASGDFVYIADYNSLLTFRYPLSSIDEGDSDVKSSMAELGCYPNPFNSRTVFTYSDGGYGPIDIFDIMGRKISSVEMTNGTAVWDANAYSSGVFFAKKRGEDSQGIKLILLK
jgi:hypothetical protein